MREFAAALARLLPDDTAHAKKVLAMSRPPASLREVMNDTSGRSLAAIKKELVEGHMALEKAAKKCGIRGQVWWGAAAEKKGSKSREVNVVQHEEESPAIQAIIKGMEAMQVTVAALAAAQAGSGIIANVDADKPKAKEESELDKLRAENDKLRATQAERSWDQRYQPKGKGKKGGKGKGPAQGCFTCGGLHYQNQCPQNPWQGKGYLGGRGGGYGKGDYGGGYGNKGGWGGYGGASRGREASNSSNSSSPSSPSSQERRTRTTRIGPSCL